LLFDYPRVDNFSVLRQSVARNALLDRIYSSFKLIFPAISFELIDAGGLINAQAVILAGGQRSVRLYGGLAFHPLAGRASLSFCLLHEIGHHLSRGCRMPSDSRLACECEADHWAATEGTSVVDFCLRSALDEMDFIFERHEDGVAIRQNECWALTWPYRKESILAKRRLNSTTCRMADSLP
jgi:hypothetical protein